MSKFTSFLKNNLKLVIALIAVLAITVVLVMWGMVSYKKTREGKDFYMDKIEVVAPTAFQAFMLNEKEWTSVPNPAGFDIVELIEQVEPPYKKELPGGYTLFVNQVGEIIIKPAKGETTKFSMLPLSKNYFKVRHISESFDIFYFNVDEMTLFSENADYRVKIYPKYFSNVIGRDASSPDDDWKFLTSIGFYILIGEVK